MVAAECLFCWYWLADLCRREQIPFVLGHASLFVGGNAITLVSVAYGLSRHEMAWEFRSYVERLLAHPGGWTAYYFLKLSCLVFLVGVTFTMFPRSPSWRQGAMVLADFVLGLIQFFALDLAYPIRE